DIDFARAAVVPLTSVRQPSELLGDTAMRLLAAEVAAGEDFVTEQVVFQPELVIRQSTTG
ncbi:MAG: substrate-binding domain-containing protein, partial [Mycetocola sp.]